MNAAVETSLTDVRLLGGPAHGLTVEIKDSRVPIVIEGHGVPEGCAARYRPADARRRVNHAYRFDGFTTVVARLPVPGGVSA